jgi:hypothetical protein
MPSPSSVRKRSLIKDSVLDHSQERAEQDGPSVKKADVTNDSRVVSRARVALPKPLPKGTAPTLA